MNPSDPNPNSVFTRALLPLLEGLKTSPTPLYLAWYQTLRNNVRGIAEKAQSNQSPKAYSGLEGEFCLLDNCAQPFSPLPQLDGEAHGYDIIQSATEQALLDYVSRYRGSASAKLAERRLAELTRKRSVLYVISVGIDEYPAPLANLRYSAKDASEILRAIQTRSGPFYQTIRGYLLTNRTATRSSILEAFDAARYSAKSTDTLIVYLSGHVATIDNEAYLVPANADLNGVRSLVSLTELQRTLALTFGRVILFVDTCGVRFTPPINTILLDRNRDAQLTVLSASEPDGLAFESDDLGHSVFAYALLKGLSGSAARFVPTAPPFSFITINDLAEFISANVRELTKGEQRPYFITSDGDFALVPFSRPQ
jgi:hypothetical protein